MVLTIQELKYKLQELQSRTIRAITKSDYHSSATALRGSTRMVVWCVIRLV